MSERVYSRRCFIGLVSLTSDGDFGYLVEFLQDKKANVEIIVLDNKKCSILIKNKNIKIIFLNYLYHEFSDKI